MLFTTLFAADVEGYVQKMAIGLVGLWPLWLPLFIGGVAIYLLLPRPRPYATFWGMIAGGAALGLGGTLLLQSNAIPEESVLFYAFSGIAITAGGMLVTQQNPARAALSFALVILATCGLFLLLAAPFLMAATIVVYAGAVVVTFLFVIMLAQQHGLSDADARSREPLLATVTGFALLSVLLYVIHTDSGPAAIDRLSNKLLEEDKAKYQDDGTRIKKILERLDYQDLNAKMDLAADADTKSAILREAKQRYASERLLRLRPPLGAQLSDMSGPAAGVAREQIRRDEKTGLPHLPAENSAFLGKSLFTEYLLPVELGGMLLLVATVGAVAIGQRRTKPRETTQTDTGVNGPTPTRVE